MTLARQWRGQRPFHETWFVEALLGPDRGLWIRYVLDAEAGEASVWAILCERTGVVAARKQVVPLGEVQGPLFECAYGALTRDRARGSIDGLSWNLRLDDRGLRHRHVPWWTGLLGVGRTYTSTGLDLRVRGEVVFQGVQHPVTAGPGVLGHLWGKQSRVKRWTWAHCNAFDREDLVFEGLSAYPGGYGPLTSLVLHADGHAYKFSRTRDLIRTFSRFDTDGWTWVFEAKRDGRVLTGRIALDPERATRVSYPRQGLVCTNTRFGRARIVLRDEARGLDLDLRSRECAFEIVDPRPFDTVI